MIDLLPHLLLHILTRSVTSEACIESKGIFCATCCQINPIRSLNLLSISWCHAWAIMNKVERWSLQNYNIISTKSFLSYLVYLCNSELLLHLIYIDERKETYGVSWNNGVSSHSDHIQGVSFILTQCWHCRRNWWLYRRHCCWCLGPRTQSTSSSRTFSTHSLEERIHDSYLISKNDLAWA